MIEPRARRAAARVLLASWLLGASAVAPALNPALDVKQYAHSAWRYREGFGRGTINGIAQTPDGYLWFSTEFGLSRFDGVRITPWTPPPGHALPGAGAGTLLTDHAGRLWIASYGGLSSLLDGRLTVYPKFSGWLTYGLREDRDGTIWVTGRPTFTVAALCSIRAGQVSCDGEDGRFGDWLGALYEDRAGRLWVSTRDGVWRWRPGPPEFFAAPGGIDTTQTMSEDDDGALLLGTTRGLMRMQEGRLVAVTPSIGLQQPRSMRILRDRDGAIWVATNAGIAHRHRGRIDEFTRADGLTGEYAGKVFEDREGNIWVATRGGLDRFSELAVATYAREQGLAEDASASVLSTRDGSIWISTPAGLDRWRDGVFAHDPYPASKAPDVPVGGGTLFEDHAGRLWLGARGWFGYRENGRWTEVDIGPAGYIDGISEDPTGRLWIVHRDRGLLRRAPDGRTTRFDWKSLGNRDFATRMSVNPRDGAVWLGFLNGGLAHLAGDHVDRRYADADGLARGRVYSLQSDADGTLWVGAAGGLSRIRGGRVATLTRDGGLPCSEVDWIIDDAGGSTWIYTACGILRVERRELDSWLDDAENGVLPRELPGKVFSVSDGVASIVHISSFAPHVGRAPDGRIWYATANGVAVIDPKHLARNPLPPPVHVEAVVANREPRALTAAALELPPLIRDLQIDYTALSLVAPEKMQFRYRLQGRDADWQDVGTRRQAFYSDLAPGRYRFQVTASNNDGVWNERGAALEFTIAPTFYQTRWFYAACVAAALLLLWLMYAIRVRQIEQRTQMRLEERIAERERIARDLHDTFLQSVQGLVLKFHAAMTRLPQDLPSRQLIEQALERADAVVLEGRNRVYGLREQSPVADLSQALTDVAQEFAHLSEAEFRVTVQGTPRTLHPLVREEAFRIGAEALVNAFRHAHARRIDVEIEYSRKELCLSVTDDGRGFDVGTLDGAAGGGHYGLTGLRERARKIRSRVQVASRPGSGSAVELRVPGSVAYAPVRQSKRDPQD